MFARADDRPKLFNDRPAVELSKFLICKQCAADDSFFCVDLAHDYCALCLGHRANLARRGACSVCGPLFGANVLKDTGRGKEPLARSCIERPLRAAFPDHNVSVSAEYHMKSDPERMRAVQDARGSSSANRAFDIFYRATLPAGLQLSVGIELVNSSGVDRASAHERLVWLAPQPGRGQRGALLVVEVNDTVGPAVMLTLQTWCAALTTKAAELPEDRVPVLIFGRPERHADVASACADRFDCLAFYADVLSFPRALDDETCGVLMPNQLHMAVRTGLIPEAPAWRCRLVDFSAAIALRAAADRPAKQARAG